MENLAHSLGEINLVLQLLKELRIKIKTGMSWSPRKEKDCILCNVYFVRRKFL